MIKSSELSQSLNGRLYIFATFTLALKFFDIRGISFNDIVLSIDDKRKLIGSVSICLLMISITSALSLWHDVLVDGMAARPTQSPPDLDYQAPPGGASTPTTASKYTNQYLFISYTLLFIATVFPIVYSLGVFVYCFGDIAYVFDRIVASVS